jgi:hypothetical protein
MRAVFVGVRSRKTFLLNADAIDKIRGNGEIVLPRWADQFT